MTASGSSADICFETSGGGTTNKKEKTVFLSISVIFNESLNDCNYLSCCLAEFSADSDLLFVPYFNFSFIRWVHCLLDVRYSDPWKYFSYQTFYFL